MILKSDAKFEEKLTLGSKNDIRNLVSFNASSSNSENLHFDILILSKVHYVWAKKSTEELCVITLKNDAKFEGELICSLKNDVGNLADFDITLEICTLMIFFWSKYTMFELKKYRGVIPHYTEDRCKRWRKNDSWFHKWHKEFGEFHQSFKNLKICTLRDFFVQSI